MASDEFEIKMKPFEGFNYPFEFVDNTQRHLHAIRNMELRPDDVFIVSYPKSGTHWAYEITYMLLSGQAEYCRKHIWLDIDPMDQIEQSPSPRIFLTHIPFERLPKQLEEGNHKIIYMSRNPKDVMVSYFSYASKLSGTALEGSWSDTFVEKFLEGDIPYDSWFRNVLFWEKFPEKFPKIPFLWLNFETMKKNSEAEISRISKFLGTNTDPTFIKAVSDKTCFRKTMEDKTENPDPRFKTFSRAGNQILYRKGEVGDWKNYFTVKQNNYFDKVYQEKMKDSKLEFDFVLK